MPLTFKNGVKSRIDLAKSEYRLASLIPERDAEPIAIVYPNEYKVGMASLGFLTLFRLLVDAGFKPERFFYDVRDKSGIPNSIESGSSLKSFERIAFHFSYELDYVNAISMLIDAKISPERADRTKSDGPVIIAGGMASSANPLPLSKFIDIVFIGEIEGTILSDLHKIGTRSELDPENGWFVSEKYLNEKGTYEVKQRTSPEWGQFESYSPIITVNTNFGVMNLVEISKGCPIQCKFCLTGGMFEKVRERKAETIIKSALVHKNRSKKVGLIGAIPSLHSKIIPILQRLLSEGMTPSLSSLSVSSLNDEIINILAKCNMKTLTLGVESFDEELQKYYGKPIPFDMLQKRIEYAFKTGFNEVKLYLILGLPGASKDEDNIIIDKVGILKEISNKAQPGARLRVSLNPFIPKITTCFERENFMGENEFRMKMESIRGKLSRLGISVTSESHRGSHLQNILSRGDERTGEVILRAARHENWKKKARLLFPNEDLYLRNSVELINQTFLR